MSLQSTCSVSVSHVEGGFALDRAIAVGGHAARVVRFADTLALRVGLSAEERASLRWASLLHDVGKMGIPDKVLKKAGPLNAGERALMNRHPEIGYQVLQGIDVSEDVRLWVCQHHERWDGRGYPGQLFGEEVALPCRVLVISEVYDALAEVRSYKSAWSIPKIVNFFRVEAGRQFDPDLAHMVADGLQAQGARFFAPELRSVVGQAPVVTSPRDQPGSIF